MTRPARVLAITAVLAIGMVALPASAARRTPAAAPRNLVGSAVAISGSVVAVGAPGVNQDTGVVYIYVRSGGKWRKRATLADPRDAQDDFFGAALAISSTKSGTSLVIGDPTGNVAYVYEGSGGTWRLRQTLHDPGTSSADSFGGPIALSGGTLVIGSPAVGNDFGVVYIYRLARSRWTLQAKLNDPRQKDLDLFGRSLSILGQLLVIGAVDVTYAYTQTARHRWVRTARIPNPGVAKDNFGAALATTGLATTGRTAVIGAPGAVPGPFYTWPGAAYVYTISGRTWKLRQKLARPGPGSFFGYSAAMAGKWLLIGMPWYGPVNCGAVFEYAWSGTTWRKRGRLGVSGCTGGDQFGDELALSGRTVVVGAPFQNIDEGAFYLRMIP